MSQKRLSLFTDEELMQSYQDGNAEAFEILFKRHSLRVFGYLKSKLRDRGHAEDVFQSTFLKLHQSRARFDSHYLFLPWLFTICRTSMIDHLRKQKTRTDISDVDVEQLADQTQAQDDPTGGEGLEVELNSAINQLPRNQKAALELRYQGELSFEEIAKRLETTPVTVRQWVSRAIRKLRVGHRS